MQRGEVRGYLLVSVAIVPAGFELNTVAPKRNVQLDLSRTLLPPSVELICKELHVKVYYAEDVVALDEDGINELYVRVSYGNQSVKSSAVQDCLPWPNHDEMVPWHEDLAVPIVVPRLGRSMVSQRVTVAVCDRDRRSRDDTVGVAHINLADVPQRTDSPHSKIWGVPRWVDLYGAPAHAGGASNGSNSSLLTKFGSRAELTRKMNSGVLPGSAYRGRVMISAFLLDVKEARTNVSKIHEMQRVPHVGRAREVANLMRLRLEALVSTPVKQTGTHDKMLPQASWRDLTHDQHNPESSKKVPAGSLLTCLASDAGFSRPPPSRSQPRAPERDLCVIRALIFEGHSVPHTTQFRSQWASIKLTVGAATVSTRRVELTREDVEDHCCSARVSWNELLELVVDCPKGRDGRLDPPDAFLELMLGGAYGEQKRISYTRIAASELLQTNPNCMIQDTLSKDLFKDRVFGAGYIPWTSNALGVRCLDAKDLRNTDTFSDPDYYVRVTLYSGPPGDIPAPDKIRQEEPFPTLYYSTPSRTQDVEVNNNGSAVWNELFRFGTPQPEGEYTMPEVEIIIVDVFDEDAGRDDHVGRALIRVRNTDHGYEVDHGSTGEREFRPVGGTKENGWPLFHHMGDSRRQQGSINLIFTQHAFVPRRKWRDKEEESAYEVRVHVFSAQELCVEDRDGVDEVFLRASMGSSDGRTMDGKSKPFTKTRSGPGPIWNQTLLFDDIQLLPPEWVQSGLSPRLMLTLWDRDTGSTPDFLAQCCIPATEIFLGSSKMDEYIAKKSSHPAQWYPLVQRDLVTRAGKVLLAFEICKRAEAGKRVWLDSTFPEKQRTVGKCTPPVRKCRLEMLVVGCRNLKSWFTDPTAPYVEMSVSNKKGGVGMSAATLPRCKPHPTSPNYIDDRILNVECELPEDRLFEPHAIVAVHDNPTYSFGSKNTLGYTRIDLSPHLPWIKENQESRSRQMMDHMFRAQKAMTVETHPHSLSITGSDPELHAALEVDKTEPWDDMSLQKVELERTLYALLIAEQQLENFRAIRPDSELVISEHRSLVSKSLVQCEKIASAALHLVQVNLRQNPATEGQKLQLWHVIESDRPSNHEHALPDFEAVPLEIDSTAPEDKYGSAHEDDLKDFRRQALLGEQLGMKLSLISCERFASAVLHTPAQVDAKSLSNGEGLPGDDIDTLERKCNAYATCIRESAKNFEIGEQTARHAKLSQLMASQCLKRCRAMLADDDVDVTKLQAIQAVCSALDDKVKALDVPPDIVALVANEPGRQSCCSKLPCWCNEASTPGRFNQLDETHDVNQLIEGVSQEQLGLQYNLPMWMLNRKVIDDELEDELERLPDSTSFRTMMTWNISDSDGKTGFLKGVIRVVDISAGSSTSHPAIVPNTDTSDARLPTSSRMELPFPRLLPELLRKSEVVARLYVTQAFLHFTDNRKLLGPDAEWYIKVLFDGDSLDQSVTVTTGDPTRPYLGYMLEFPVTLPGPSVLRLELYDQDKFSRDDLIGTTEIDLEDRYYNEGWRALGQPVHVATTSILAQTAGTRTAQAVRADDVRTTEPLSSRSTGCCGLLSLVRPNNSNEMEHDGDQEPLQLLEMSRESVEHLQDDLLDADDVDFTSTDESQLTLQKPIERRNLRLPGSNQLQGKLEMWIDLLTKDQAVLVDPVDIRPPEIHNFELRMVVWSVRGCPISDWVTTASDLKVSADLHVVASKDERTPTVLTQDTDTHCA